MAQPLVKRANVTTTGVPGAIGTVAAGSPFGTYALQVKGTGAAPTSWSVTLDVSLDGVNFTTILTHNSTDGSTVFETTGKPALYFRVNVASLSLGSATDIAVTAVAVP